MHVVVQTLLEHATTEIVGLAPLHLSNGGAELGIAGARLLGSLGEPSGFEDARGLAGTRQVAPGATIVERTVAIDNAPSLRLQ
jgi:hypothetical protein